MTEKILCLHRVLDRRDIPHAFGGAIAVDFYRVPRATIDIDLNVFVPPSEHRRVIDALSEEFTVEGAEDLSQEIIERDQGKTYWDETRIDLFFASSDFHQSMARRARAVDYQDSAIPILSAEDIVTIKAVFDRAQDWADIEAVCMLRGAELDRAYIAEWLGRLVGSDDPRAVRVMGMIDSAPS